MVLISLLMRRVGGPETPVETTEMVDACRSLLELMPPGYPHRHAALAYLGVALSVQQHPSENPRVIAIFRESLELFDEAIRLLPPGVPFNVQYRCNRTAALVQLAECTNDRTFLDQAVADLRALRTENPGNASVDLWLGMALQKRGERIGRPQDLDEAIPLLRTTMIDLPHDHQGRMYMLISLGEALVVRGSYSGSHRAMAEGADMLRQALDASSPDMPLRGVGVLAHAANQLNIAVREQRWDLLDELIASLRELLSATAEPSRVKAVGASRLGEALNLRYRLSQRQADLDEAIEATSSAAAIDTGNVLDRVRAARVRADSLQLRYDAHHDEEDLRVAMNVLDGARAELPDGHPLLASLNHDFAALAIVALARTRDSAYYVVARDLLREAAEARYSPVKARLVAAESLLGLAVAVRDDATSAQTAQLAVDLLPVHAWHGFDRADQEFNLAMFNQVATDAAAAVLQNDKASAKQALALLEKGRGVLLQQALRTRADLTRLRERAPQLAKRLDTLRSELDGEFDDEAQAAADRRSQAAHEWDRLVEQVRRNGFALFLEGPDLRKLRRAASAGPVAVLNVSDVRSDALILTRRHLRRVPLPGLTPAAVRERVTAFRAALDEKPDEQGTPAQQQAAAAIRDILGWLWHEVTAPVLAHLELTGPRRGGRWPRIWWCPTGLLAALPLHAAGTGQPGESVLDRVVSSYTPTVHELVRTRSRPRPPETLRRLLAVTVPESPDTAPIPSASKETRLLAERLPGTTRLDPSDSTPQRTRDELLRHAWAHFACHGNQDLANPSQGELVLTDGRLTVLDISRMRLDHAEFAFLSACDSALGGKDLPDESIHLAAALQLAGFTHVIGTLWPIGDAPARRVVQDVYAPQGGDRFEPEQSAFALHRATRALRERYPDSPWAWAAHVHFGP
ncbi:hypothetical protein DMH04_14180 [Kibdelosporangium aridum]|uniref:CHAT domain-containing protein n=2 Tax=Kibdelosporangium aridum TaxID=2030 RepID=A0A428ZEL0_KIBAR|nr:hypothetical protein DMH04_14180 [Kibdelosporangium aridum]